MKVAAVIPAYFLQVFSQTFEKKTFKCLVFLFLGVLLFCKINVTILWTTHSVQFFNLWLQWRHSSQERDNPIRRTSCFAPYSYGSSRDDGSQVLSQTRPSSANAMHRRINHGCHPDDKCIHSNIAFTELYFIWQNLPFCRSYSRRSWTKVLQCGCGVE